LVPVAPPRYTGMIDRRDFGVLGSPRGAGEEMRGVLESSGFLLRRMMRRAAWCGGSMRDRCAAASGAYGLCLEPAWRIPGAPAVVDR
jgi:hypothetical protein